MSSGEGLRGAFRRSRWLVLFTTVLGVVAALALSAVTTPVYEASATLLINDVDSEVVLPGGGGSGSDPLRNQATAISLARTTEFERRVERSLGGGGRPDAASNRVSDSFTIEPRDGTNLLEIVGSGETEAEAVALTSAVATTFPRFLGEKLVEPLRRTEQALRDSIADGSDDPETRQAISRLGVLMQVSSRSAVVVDLPTEAEKTQPQPARAAIIGLTTGLVLGLLLIALREAMAGYVHNGAEVAALVGSPVVSVAERRRFRGQGLRRSGASAGSPYERLAVWLQGYSSLGRGTVVALVSATDREDRSTAAAGLVGALQRRGETVCAVDSGAPSFRLEGALRLLGPIEVREVEGPAGARRLRVLAGLGREHVGSETAIEHLGQLAGGNGYRADYRETIGHLAADFDWVVVDVPGALASPLAAEFARTVDAMVVVTRPASATRAELADLGQQIESWTTRPSGTIIIRG